MVGDDEEEGEQEQERQRDPFGLLCSGQAGTDGQVTIAYIGRV